MSVQLFVSKTVLCLSCGLIVVVDHFPSVTRHLGLSSELIGITSVFLSVCWYKAQLLAAIFDSLESLVVIYTVEDPNGTQML